MGCILLRLRSGPNWKVWFRLLKVDQIRVEAQVRDLNSGPVSLVQWTREVLLFRFLALPWRSCRKKIKGCGLTCSTKNKNEEKLLWRFPGAVGDAAGCWSLQTKVDWFQVCFLLCAPPSSMLSRSLLLLLLFFFAFCLFFFFFFLFDCSSALSDFYFYFFQYGLVGLEVDEHGWEGTTTQ